MVPCDFNISALIYRHVDFINLFFCSKISLELVPAWGQSFSSHLRTIHKVGFVSLHCRLILWFQYWKVFLKVIF